MIAFLDTNVLLDVLEKRELFLADSAPVWALAERSEIEGFVSALSLPNVFYVLRRLKGLTQARLAMGLLRDIFEPVALDKQILHQAMDADFGDFEDAIQFFSALRCEAAVLITRNTADFPRQDLAIQTPAEFLATHFPE